MKIETGENALQGRELDAAAAVASGATWHSPTCLMQVSATECGAPASDMTY